MASTSTKKVFLSALVQAAHRADLSDFTITCQGEDCPVYGMILRRHSPVLNRACSGEFMLSHHMDLLSFQPSLTVSQEGREQKYDLSEYDVDQIESLVEYIYTFDYQLSNDSLRKYYLRLHINMCVLADKCDVPGLKMLATNKSKDTIGNVAIIDLAEHVALAYDAEGATAEIRKALVNELVTYGVFEADNDENEGNAFEGLLGSYPRFAIDIVRAQSEYRSRKSRMEAS